MRINKSLGRIRAFPASETCYDYPDKLQGFNPLSPDVAHLGTYPIADIAEGWRAFHRSRCRAIKEVRSSEELTLVSGKCPILA